jgi:hypothetical protein
MTATLLPRAMEYETTSRWRNSYRKKPSTPKRWRNSYRKKASTPKSFLYDVCLGICNHGTFAPYKAEEPRSPSIIECYRQIKANRKMNKTRTEALDTNQVNQENHVLQETYTIKQFCELTICP